MIKMTPKMVDIGDVYFPPLVEHKSDPIARHGPGACKLTVIFT